MKKLDLILDTDAGSDCDDMMALAYLIYAQKTFNANIKAITYSHNCHKGPAGIRAVFRYFNEKAPEIGVMTKGSKLDDLYIRAIAEKFALPEDEAPAPDAVSTLRRALADSTECIICAIGPLTNIAALLKSEPDDISPLNGLELVKAGCSQMIIMAGEFVPDQSGRLNAEWNVKCDIPAARTVADTCPVPLAWLPFETGCDLMTGKPIVEKYGMSSPISASFMIYPWAKDGRHSWDPATVMYAVEGGREFFSESFGTVYVDENGVTSFGSNENGSHRIITVNTKSAEEIHVKDEAATYLNACVMKLHELCGK